MEESMYRRVSVYEEYLGMYRRRTKTLEIRLGYPMFRSIHPDQMVTFYSSEFDVDVRIVAVREYRTIGDVMEAEDASRIVPGMSPTQIVTGWRRKFRIQLEEQYGILVFEVTLANDAPL